MTDSGAAGPGVGPVLHATPFARAVVAAIEEENDPVTVEDHGAYLRVSVPGVCRLSRATVEAVVGHAVAFPGDLEVVMSSFAGQLRLDDQSALWWVRHRDPNPPDGPA